MKCPLLRSQWRKTEEGWESEWADCLKEKCALYHGGLGDCGFFLIQEYLALIMAQLVELNKLKGGK